MEFTSAMILIGAVLLLSIAGYGESSKERHAAEIIDGKVYANGNVHYQFSFLYLHDHEGEVYFDNADVQRVLDDHGKLSNVTSPWPSNSGDTNFLLTLLDKSGRGEFKFLSHLKNMIAGYKIGYKHCPKYIILGTVRTPCLASNEHSGCAVDYVVAKEEFAKTCPHTKYYLYVRCPFLTRNKIILKKVIKLIEGSDIIILYPYNYLISEFDTKYCSR